MKAIVLKHRTMSPLFKANVFVKEMNLQANERLKNNILT